MCKYFFMTVKLNLTIDEKIVAKSKRYAAKRKTTVSKIVQDLLKRQLDQEDKMGKKSSFVEKWAGVFSGQLSDTRIRKLKDEYLSTKYGY